MVRNIVKDINLLNKKAQPATKDDLETINFLEKTCFLKTEAASYESLRSRLEVYSEGYDILYVDNKAVGYIGGLKNDTLELNDDMYHDSSLHCPRGRYQTIFSGGFVMNLFDDV